MKKKLPPSPGTSVFKDPRVLQFFTGFTSGLCLLSGDGRHITKNSSIVLLTFRSNHVDVSEFEGGIINKFCVCTCVW